MILAADTREYCLSSINITNGNHWRHGMTFVIFFEGEGRAICRDHVAALGGRVTVKTLPLPISDWTSMRP